MKYVQSLEKRIQSYEVGEVDLMNFEQRLSHDPGLQLPEPKPMMSAKTYREKLGLPVIEKLKKIIKELLVRYSRAMDKLIKLAQQNSELYKRISGYYRPSYISLSYTGQNLLSNTSTAHLQLCYKVNTMPGDTSQAVPQGLICYQFWVY